MNRIVVSNISMAILQMLFPVGTLLFNTIIKSLFCILGKLYINFHRPTGLIIILIYSKLIKVITDSVQVPLIYYFNCLVHFSCYSLIEILPYS